jgi:hypothetical protein
VDASVVDLLETKLKFNYPERMPQLRAEVGFRRQRQIKKPALRRLRNHPALAWIHGDPEVGVTLLKHTRSGGRYSVWSNRRHCL